MKRLSLLRHGHAQAQAEGGDFERSLDARGRTEALRAAKALLEVGSPPKLVLASAAKRTAQTATIFIEQLRSLATEPVMRAERSLYQATADDLLSIIMVSSDELDHLLIIGHNPGISELALRWANSLDETSGFRGFATAGWCSVIFDSLSWSALGRPTSGRFAASPG